MGMDCYGESGNGLRNNVWWWRPLANYCLEVAPNVCAPCEHWHDNSGDGLDALSSLALADLLQTKINNGECQKYAEAYEAEIAAMPDETCHFCGGTGTRNDEHVKGACNSCEGKGHKRPFDTWYPFSVENVQEFADFLKASGGFKIC